VDVIIVPPTVTPTPTATNTPTPTVTPDPTITPTSTPNCDFDVDVIIVPPTATPTPTPTNTPTPTVTPDPTPNCEFDVDVIIVPPTVTPTPTPTSTPTPTPTPTLDCTLEASFTEFIGEEPGEPVSCSEGMDVVFLVDYTGSMGDAINGVKSSISSIANTIITESNNDYRLGLVIFDEYGSGTVSNYSSKTAYTTLPSNQKYINTGLNSKYQWITAVEKMSTNNQTSFTTQLNLLNTTNFPLGSGIGGPEPSDMGIDLIGTEDFAGTFRSGVSKLLIVITDNVPSGNDDDYTQTDINFVNGLTPELLNKNVRVLLMTTSTNSVLNDLANNTNGLVSNGFSGNDIITAIQNICV
jgi:hypothetical protein